MKNDRVILIRTGVGGMQIFDDELYYKATKKRRLYINKKLVRLLSRAFKIEYSKYTKLPYRLVNS